VTTTDFDFVAEAESEILRASQPRASRKPVFLFLQEGQKALVRPLYNLPECIVFMKHQRWSQARDERVDNICGQEVSKPCIFCEMFVEDDDKKLEPRKAFYVPIFVYGVKDKSGSPVTFTNAETQAEEPVKGFRVLELSAFGTISSVFKTFVSYYKDEDSHNVTVCDFSIEQTGSGQTKSFVTMPKAPKVADARIMEKRPSIKEFREAILAARPPIEPHNGSTGGGTSDVEGDFDF
jgi:hypothetical protein